MRLSLSSLSLFAPPSFFFSPYKTATRFNNTFLFTQKKVSEYDQEIPQLQTADKPMTSRGRATYQSRDTRKSN